MMPMITMAAAVAAYRDGNDRGAGYAPYTDKEREDTIAEAVACAERDGWTVVLDRTNSDTVSVLRSAEGKLMAIGGDAMGRGAWAVDITGAVQFVSAAERFEDAVKALRAEAAEAGDLRMVAVCDRALDPRDDFGTEEARAECARVISDHAAAL